MSHLFPSRLLKRTRDKYGGLPTLTCINELISKFYAWIKTRKSEVGIPDEMPVINEPVVPKVKQLRLRNDERKCYGEADKTRLEERKDFYFAYM